MRLIWGTAKELLQQRVGYCELLVKVDGREGTAKAICYPELTGAVEVGERVLLNTTAVDLELGTGGKHFVVARGDTALRSESPAGSAFTHSAGVARARGVEGSVATGVSNGADVVQFDEAMKREAGHLMKLRYTPHQLNVLSVEAQESPYHRVMKNRDSLEGVPVVCCGLHSQVPLVAAAIKKAMPTLVVGYVMDDAASLALNLSDILADSVEAELIDLTVSTGQVFGGQIEAINLHSGLLAAVHVGGCDVVIAAIGPGLAGTGTPFGHGGVAQGEAINAAAVLGGAPVVCLRMSQADSRQRHLGISHHSITALSRVALAPATIAIPYVAEDNPFAAMIDAELDALPNVVGHTAFQLEESFYDEAALRGVKVKTMGRDFEQDPLFFEAASAAGAVSAMIAVMTIEQEAAEIAEGREAALQAGEGASAGAVAAMGGGCSPHLSDCASSCPSAGSCDKLR